MLFKTKKLLLAAFCILQFQLEAINSKLLHQKLAENTPQWMVDQIQHDLAPFEKELSKAFLDEIFKNEVLCLVRVRVKKGKLTFEKSKSAKNHITTNKIIPYIYALHKLKPLPDIDFVFTAHDAIFPESCPKKGYSPIFCITKSRKDKNFILFPDWFALKSFEPQKSEIRAGNKKWPWEKKSPLVFFRGGDSGTPDSSKWRSYPRPKLVALSLKYPDLINARFAKNLYHPEWFKTAKKEGFIGDYVSIEKHPQYKYLMDIDGNCAATPRFPVLLHSNSVILKNMTDSMLWFYGTLKPYIHFIPVTEDLSNLLEQIEWAKHHDKECREISENARHLADEIFTEEAIYLYLYRLLEEYAKKQVGQYQLDIDFN